MGTNRYRYEGRKTYPFRIHRPMTSSMPLQYAAHRNERPDRNAFCARLLRERGMTGPILNVGSGGKEFLKKSMPESEITDIDICGAVDHVINLEKDLPLPFKTASYETVLCLDVLEHLDNFHAVFDELLRVTRSNLVISLPNAPAGYFRNLLFNLRTDRNHPDSFGRYAKYYGLPLAPPKDRHKWFLGLEDALAFFEHHAPLRGYRVTDVLLVGEGGWKHTLPATIFPRLYKALVPPAFWILMRKPS